MRCFMGISLESRIQRTKFVRFGARSCKVNQVSFEVATGHEPWGIELYVQANTLFNSAAETIQMNTFISYIYASHSIAISSERKFPIAKTHTTIIIRYYTINSVIYGLPAVSPLQSQSLPSGFSFPTNGVRSSTPSLWMISRLQIGHNLLCVVNHGVLHQSSHRRGGGHALLMEFVVTG